MSALAIRQVLVPAAPGASARSTTRTRCDCVSAPRVLAEPFASLWLEGGLLLHLGGLVPGCCTWEACTESGTAGADGCTDNWSGELELGGGKRVTAHHHAFALGHDLDVEKLLIHGRAQRFRRKWSSQGRQHCTVYSELPLIAPQRTRRLGDRWYSDLQEWDAAPQKNNPMPRSRSRCSTSSGL